MAVGYGTDLAARRQRAAVLSTPLGALTRLSAVVEVWRQRVLPAVVPQHAAAADRARDGLSAALELLAASLAARGARPEFMVDADNRAVWLKRSGQSGRSGARSVGRLVAGLGELREVDPSVCVASTARNAPALPPAPPPHPQACWRSWACGPQKTATARSRAAA